MTLVTPSGPVTAISVENPPVPAPLSSQVNVNCVLLTIPELGLKLRLGAWGLDEPVNVKLCTLLVVLFTNPKVTVVLGTADVGVKLNSCVVDCPADNEPVTLARFVTPSTYAIHPVGFEVICKS